MQFSAKGPEMSLFWWENWAEFCMGVNSPTSWIRVFRCTPNSVVPMFFRPISHCTQDVVLFARWAASCVNETLDVRSCHCSATDKLRLPGRTVRGVRVQLSVSQGLCPVRPAQQRNSLHPDVRIRVRTSWQRGKYIYIYIYPCVVLFHFSMANLGTYSSRHFVLCPKKFFSVWDMTWILKARIAGFDVQVTCFSSFTETNFENSCIWLSWNHCVVNQTQSSHYSFNFLPGVLRYSQQIPRQWRFWTWRRLETALSVAEPLIQH